MKGFVPRSTAAKSGLIQEFDLLVRVDGTDVHRWPVSEIAPLMLGPAGSNVTLGFLRRIPAANESGQVADDLSLNGSMKSKVPKLWKQGDTPRNEAARSDNCAHFVILLVLCNDFGLVPTAAPPVTAKENNFGFTKSP